MKKEIKIENSISYDAKMVSSLVSKINTFKDIEVFFELPNKRANAKSLIGMLSLGLKQNVSFSIVVSGKDELKVINEIENYLKSL